MKKPIFLFFIFVLFLIPPVSSHASYVILLKNGNRLSTPLYWEEDGEIKFYLIEGIMGIEKNTVRKIEKIPGSSESYFHMDRAEKIPVAAPAPETVVTGGKVAGGEKENLQKKQLREEYDKLETEVAGTAEKYNEASELPEEERNVIRNELLQTMKKKKAVYEKLQGTTQN